MWSGRSELPHPEGGVQGGYQLAEGNRRTAREVVLAAGGERVRELLLATAREVGEADMDAGEGATLAVPRRHRP